MRTTPKRHFWMILFLLLTACNLRQFYAPTTPVPTLTVTATQPTPTASPIASPTVPPTSTPTRRPSPTANPTPTNTPIPMLQINGLRMAYIFNGNLYVQDSGGLPRQLTSSGMDHTPTFSIDGEKVIFYRGTSTERNDVYVINQDGTQEHILITADLLTAFNAKYSTITEPLSISLIPNTQQLLFDTQEFQSSDDFYDLFHHQYSTENHDLLSVDIATFKIRKIFSPGKIYRFPNISPNGNLMTDGINVFRSNGEFFRTRLTSYWPHDVSLVTGPSLVWAFWPPDLSRVIILPPLDKKVASKPGPVQRTTWQYFFDGSQPVETRLHPALIGIEAISPDGNLIVYSYSGDDNWKRGIYLGDLQNSGVRLLRETLTSTDIYPAAYFWNPDNIHFVFKDQKDRLYLGDIHGKTVVYSGSGFLGWLDSTHYIYGPGMVREIGKEGITAFVPPAPIENPGPENLAYIYIKPK